MKFLIISMIMFLTFLIININIVTINGLKNSMKFTSQLDNLKDKYKEKIFYGEVNQSKIMNDTVIIESLEKKIKTIYKKLNLNTEELVHLKKITSNVDEYIVFLKILIDKLNSVRKLERNINQNTEINSILKNEKDRSLGKKGDYGYMNIKSPEKNMLTNVNKNALKNQSLVGYNGSDNINSIYFEPKGKLADKMLKNESVRCDSHLSICDFLLFNFNSILYKILYKINNFLIVENFFINKKI